MQRSEDSVARRLTVGVFPGAGAVHLYHALDSGYFHKAGLEVDLVRVVSSDQQMAGWNDGDYDIMHTSPDHLLRGLLKRDPVAVQAEGMGELAVHRRPGTPSPTDRWAGRSTTRRAPSRSSCVPYSPTSSARRSPTANSSRWAALRRGSRHCRQALWTGPHFIRPSTSSPRRRDTRVSAGTFRWHPTSSPGWWCRVPTPPRRTSAPTWRSAA